MGIEVSDELLGTFVPVLIYWAYSGIYVLLDSFEKYRLHTKKDEDEKNSVSKRTVVKGVLLQQTVQAIVAIILFTVTGNDGGDEGTKSSFIDLARQFVTAMVVLDTWQYFMHRYMHHNKFLYKHIHSQHHRLVVPYAFGALYNHPLEGLLLDTIGGALSFLLSDILSNSWRTCMKLTLIFKRAAPKISMDIHRSSEGRHTRLWNLLCLLLTSQGYIIMCTRLDVQISLALLFSMFSSKTIGMLLKAFPTNNITIELYRMSVSYGQSFQRSDACFIPRYYMLQVGRKSIPVWGLIEFWMWAGID